MKFTIVYVLSLLSAIAMPCNATPKVTDLNLEPRPLIWNYRRAEIEAIATEAFRNGVEPQYIRALIKAEAALSPTRTYKYSELDRLVDSIYQVASKKVILVAGGK